MFQKEVLRDFGKWLIRRLNELKLNFCSFCTKIKRMKTGFKREQQQTDARFWRYLVKCALCLFVCLSGGAVHVVKQAPQAALFTF